MPFAPVTISDGQVSGVDDLGAAASSVVNFEVDEAGINRPRPALSTYAVTGLTSNINGLEKWSAYTIATDTDRKIYAVADASPSSAAAVSTAAATTKIEGSKRPTFAAGEDHIYAAGGGRLQRWGPSLVTAEVVSNSPRCTHVAALGQYLIANDIDAPDTIRWSDIGEGAWTTWPTANVTTVDARPDAVVAVYENLSELFVFGESTLQVYVVGSDPTLPFDKASTINLGLGAPYCAIRLDESFAFLDNYRRIVTSDGRGHQVISDAIARDLRGLATVSDAWGYREEVGQNSRLVFRFPTEGRTFVYDIKGQRWYERKKYTAPFQGDFAVNAYSYRAADNSHIVGTSAGLAKLVTNSRQDQGSPLVCERVTGWHEHGSKNRKRFGRLRATMRRGTGATNATTGALEVRTQFDDGPWSGWKQIEIGTPDKYKQVRDLWCAGIAVRCRYHVRYSNTENTSLVSLEHEVTDLGAP